MSQSLGLADAAVLCNNRRRRGSYQEGPVSAMRHPEDLLARFDRAVYPEAHLCSAARFQSMAASDRSASNSNLKTP
jgi:hypothetical protein